MVYNMVSTKYIKTIDFFLEYSNHLSIFIAYVIILVGIIEGIVFLIKNAVNDELNIKILDRRTNNIIETRIKVLNSINLGLVFIIAGDIIKTLYMPDMITLIKVVSLIGVREILSVFTHKEIEYLKKARKETLIEEEKK